MPVGIQTFDENGLILFDSNYPAMRLDAEGSVVVTKSGLNSLFEIPSSLPVNRPGYCFMTVPTGVFISKARLQTTGKFSMQAFNAENLSQASAPAGTTAQYQTFAKGVNASGSRSGFQTFDENGVLTFDSDSQQLEINKFIFPEDWTLHQTRTNSVDRSYTDRYYSAPSLGYTSFFILEERLGDSMNVTETRAGFRTGFANTIFIATSTRNNGVTTRLPTVVLGKATNY